MQEIVRETDEPEKRRRAEHGKQLGRPRQHHETDAGDAYEDGDTTEQGRRFLVPAVAARLRHRAVAACQRTHKRRQHQRGRHRRHRRPPVQRVQGRHGLGRRLGGLEIASNAKPQGDREC